jgi:hypothetical protein
MSRSVLGASEAATVMTPSSFLAAAMRALGPWAAWYSANSGPQNQGIYSSQIGTDSEGVLNLR